MNQRAVLLVGGFAAACVLAAGWYWLRDDPTGGATESSLPRNWPALPREVAVEVLNATKVVGLARVGTLALRQAGFDVKFFDGADSVQKLDRQTRVLIRAGDTTGLGRVLEVVGNVRVEDKPDRNRVVDFTVILGDDYRGIQKKP